MRTYDTTAKVHREYWVRMSRERLAEGATAEVFAWGKDQILKLYREGYPAGEAQREAQRARVVHAVGLPSPAVIDVVQVDGRQGVVYERVRGPSITQILLTEPDRVSALAAQLAELHHAMHAHVGAALPAQHLRLRERIEKVAALDPDVRTQVLRVLAQLPREAALCHGDFHPDNVLMTAQGPVIIDWVDATQGAPVADVARTQLLMRYASLPHYLDAETRRRVDAARQQFVDAYLHRYQQLRPLRTRDLMRWEIPLAAARLDERLDVTEQQRLLDRISTGLQQIT